MEMSRLTGNETVEPVSRDQFFSGANGDREIFISLFDLFGYASKTVLYAKELTSVSMCYSQGNGFYTPV